MKNLVLIGYGGMGTRHLGRLKNVTEISVAGVYDIDPAKREMAVQDGYRTYTTLTAVLKDQTVDIVLVATPNDSHKEISIKAMEAGKHVICEKPVTLSTQDFQDILDVAAETKCCFMVDQNRRWDENFLMVKKLYDEETLGRIYDIENRVQGSRGIPQDWRQNIKQGGGMVYDWCVHLLDRMLILKAGHKVVSLYADLSGALGHEVDDGFRIILRFDDEMRANLEVQTRNFIKLPEWYVSGATGTAVIEDFELHGKYVTLEGDLTDEAIPVEAGAGFTKTMAPRTDGSVKEHPLPRVPTDVCDFYRNFVAWIDGKEEPIVKNSEVMRTMTLIEKIFESAQKNEVVKFSI